MNQACIFEPVSSTSSTAFVPLSAVAGGQLAPGTPLYGAYGQPLPPDVQLMPDVHNQVYPSMRSPAGSMPPSSPQDRLPPPFPSHRGPNGHASHQQQPPYAYPDDRRRPHEEDHAMRLPPPAPAASSGGAMSHDDNDSSRRRSPASTHSSEGMSQHYPPPPPPPGGYESRPSPPHRASPGAQPTGAGSQPAASVMSLGNLMDGAPPPPGPSKSADIDKNMLGRLDHRR